MQRLVNSSKIGYNLSRFQSLTFFKKELWAPCKNCVYNRSTVTGSGRDVALLSIVHMCNYSTQRSVGFTLSKCSDPRRCALTVHEFHATWWPIWGVKSGDVSWCLHLICRRNLDELNVTLQWKEMFAHEILKQEFVTKDPFKQN